MAAGAALKPSPLAWAVQRARLPGGRLHLQQGPIDLVIGARGDPAEVERTYSQASARFDDVLETLVAELPLLRTPVGAERPQPRGPVARRMVDAVWPHRAVFVTPMAAVAGAVADEVMTAMLVGRTLATAYVNNGGDVALHVSPGERLRAGVVANLAHPALDALADISGDRPTRGVATSGWRGRSFSLGIAESATIFARDAASADAAATIVGNAVDADHPAIRRAPANHLRDDTDLGALPVTVEVGALPAAIVEAALECGAATAKDLIDRGLIHAAALSLQGAWRIVGGERAIGVSGI